MVDISKSLAIQGWMSETELEWLAKTAATKRRIIEVGSWKGRSTLAMASHMIQDSLIWAVDHWNGSIADGYPCWKELMEKGSDAVFAEFCENLKDHIETRLLIMRCPSTMAAAALGRNYGRIFDFVFIDGDHGYDIVSTDIDSYQPLVVPGGLLSGHDIGHSGVRQAVSERFAKFDCPAGQIWSVRI